MNTNTRIKTFAALVIAVTGALGTGVAQARPDVQWSVSIGVPLAQVYSQPAPVYYEPAPVYYQPRPIYVQPQPYHRDRDYDYGYGRQVEYRYPTRWDRDADGIPDRYERRHGRRGDRDRDRDGVPDRYDYRPGDSWRH